MPLHLRISGAATDMDDARCAGIVLVHGGHMRHSASEMHLCIHTWFIKSFLQPKKHTQQHSNVKMVLQALVHWITTHFNKLYDVLVG